MNYTLKKHKFTKLALSVAILGTSAILPLQNFVHADESTENVSVDVDQYALDNELIYNETTRTTYTNSGQIESKEITEEAVTNDGDVVATETTEVPVLPVIQSSSNTIPFSPKAPKDLGPNYAVINPGGIQYKLVDKFNGDNGVLVTASAWIKDFAVAVIPEKLTKNIWAKGAGTATANAFLPVISKRYYTTWVYQDSDSQASYGKAVAKEYTSSKRTTLKDEIVFISRVPK